MARRFIPHFVILSAVLIAACSAVAYLRYVRAVHGERGCAQNLQTIGRAILIYANEHDGHLPDRLQTAARGTELRAITFVCPLDDRQRVDPTASVDPERLVEGGRLSYVYTGRGLTLSTLPDNAILAFEPLAHHPNGMNVLRGDGSVEFLNARRGRDVIAKAAAGSGPIEVPP